MTLSEFIVNLAEMNEGDDFPEDLLTAMYESIREEPLQFQRLVGTRYHAMSIT
jgi:Sec7-like guanine-nucleotide exchange factor